MDKSVQKNCCALIAWGGLTCTLLLAVWYRLNGPLDGIGVFFILIVAAGALGLLVIFVAAIGIGIATGTTVASILGMICGLLMGIAGISMWEEEKRQQEALRLIQQAAEVREDILEFQAFTKAVMSADRAAIEGQLNGLRRFSIARAVCLLTREVQENIPDRYFPDLAPEVRYPVTTQQVMFLADIIASMNMPQNERDIVLYSVLTMLARRDAADFFPAWLALWKKGQGIESVQYLVSNHPYQPGLGDYECPQATTESLAEIPIAKWRDKAILTWLDNGLLFKPEQHRTVLENVDKATTLAVAVKAGVDPNAPNYIDRGHPHAPQSYPVMRNIQQRLGLRLDQAENPEEVAELVEEFVRLGANIKMGTPKDEDTLCWSFLSDEAGRGASEDDKKSLEYANARIRAVQRIKLALCGKHLSMVPARYPGQ